ncbi:MAG: phage terminase large subunit [Burkholderiales bacterium]
MEVNLQVNIKFLPYLYDYSYRYNIYYGGRGSGKSHFETDKLIIRALTEQRRILFVRKYGVDIKDSVWLMARVYPRFCVNSKLI